MSKPMTARALTLRLQPVDGGAATRISLCGSVSSSAMTVEHRRRLLFMLACWADEALDVVLFVDGRVGLPWCEEWTDALDAVPDHRCLSVRFEVCGARAHRE
jgi:hypothetical protein